ncbi:hypothetical protein Leryth_013470 [Lithospermum erythrorhizon]|nr:hypothetical protein Leryth_013470 [Lithospermum erythrorhizon]
MDVHGSDNPIPLSPQWLQPKSGESKAGVFPAESHSSRPPGHAGHLDTLKSPGVDDGLENHKKKDVFRPSVLDMEYGRRDHWLDEERDSNSPARKDRWRDGDKELSANRKVDRWTDSSGRLHGEVRRAPPERWSDSGNRDGNHDQRRDNKWNNRWGRDDKEMDGGREKWAGSGKDVDMFVDKGSSNLLAPHGKDEKEGDQYRSWRSASSNNRGRGDHTQHQPLTPNKPVPAFVHGRGFAESGSPTFPLGRGKINSGGSSVNLTPSHLQPMGSFSDKVEASHGETSLLRYHRTKLLDIYRRTEMNLSWKFLEGAVQVPSLTQEEPVEPLAFCSPNPEELVILKGIDKGDVVSSGAPQVTKDGPVNRNSNDFMQSRRSKIGSREDFPNTVDYNKDGHVDNAKGEDGRSYPHGGVWRSPSIGERIHSTSHDSREKSSESGGRNSEMSWSQPQKDPNCERDSSLTDSSSSRNEGLNPILKRQTSLVLGKEPDSARLSQSSPEDLVLYYKDPQGAIQGPFSGIDVIGWFEAGYFGIDLQVRLAGAPADSPFSLLGDVMPHLRAKANPPPGFGASKLNELSDRPSSNFSSTGKLTVGSNDINVVKNQPRYIPGPAMEADNRFIESLMTGNKGASLDKFPLSEGMQGFIGNNANALPSLGAEGGENAYLLEKAMSFERQKSLLTPYPYWPARDSPSLPKSEIMQESSLQRPSLLPSIADNAHLQQSHSLNVDLMSILQGGERSSTNVVNGVGGWPGFPRQGGLDPLKEKLDTHQDQTRPAQTTFGIHQQRLQPQNQSTLTNPMDNPASMLTTEKLLAAGLSQDPQLLSLLQQQYLMAAQSQSPIASQQLSLLDKLLLMKQQQKQEEQQQLLRQQQQLLSQVLMEHQAQQRLAQPPHGQLPSAGFSLGNASVDQPQIPPSPELFQIGSQAQILPFLNEHLSNLGLPSSVSQDASHVVGPRMSSVPLPHQISGNTVQQSWISPMSREVEDNGSLMASTMSETLPRMGNQTLQSIESVRISASEVASDAPLTKVSCEIVSMIPEKVAQPIASLEPLQGKEEQIFDDSLVINEVKNVETSQAKKSEKKSKKHKASKPQVSDSAKGVSNVQQPNQSQVKTSNNKEVKSDIQSNSIVNNSHPQVLLVSMDLPDDESLKMKSESEQVVPIITHLNPQLGTGTKAWKPAPGFKPKSLLEIQEEEQRRAHAEMEVNEISTSLASMNVSTPWAGAVSNSSTPWAGAVSNSSAPWAGVVSNSDDKSFRETQQDLGDTESIVPAPEGSVNNKSKKCQPLDLLADNVVVKSTVAAVEKYDGGSNRSFGSTVISQNELLDDDNFIEAKDTKKSRKKSGKAKSSGSKVSAPSFSADSASGAISVAKGKISAQVQQEDILPAVPSGPSLGDFVLWKGESPNYSPAPAWSTESVKPSKATSLRDILKEQEKKVVSAHNQIGQNLQKPITNSTSKGSESSWSISSSPPAKAATPIQINSQSKHKVDDDLFWGPIDQSKQESKQSDFPQLGSQRGSKITPPKGTLGGSLSKQKSVSGRGLDYSVSSSPASAHSKVKGKIDASSKESEAMDFREWCESESFRLIGTKDTSFLEFCLKQSRSEAEVLLVENIGSYDPDHEFIEKFLNYKDLLPADVLDIAFQGRNDRKSAGSGAGNMISGNVGHNRVPEQKKATPEAASKKKGKKGKKVSPSVLGFSVVSNRIMMGEIQTPED